MRLFSHLLYDMKTLSKCKKNFYFILLSALNIVTAACGLQGRVVGGIDAPNNAASFIVSIQLNGMHYCGGSILSKNLVVTAAHCLASKSQIMSSQLVAGTNNIAKRASTAQVVRVSNYVVNDLYNGGTSPYDIGLIYTSQSFQWTDAVAPIALPRQGSVPTGYATLFGWGSTSTTQSASFPSQLKMAANIPIISHSVCESALGSKGADVHDTNICTGPLTGGISICSADSGGPLVQTNSAGQLELVGIVSWGKTPCGQANSPSVYVNVGSVINWIQKYFK